LKDSALALSPPQQRSKRWESNMSATDLFIQILSGLSRGMIIFIVASGLTLIFGVLRVPNMAHGSFFMIGAFAAYTIVRLVGEPTLGFLSALLIVRFFVAFIGLVIEILMIRRVYRRVHEYQLILTFGLSIALADLVKLIWGPQFLTVPRPTLLQGGVEFFGRSFPTYYLFLLVVGVCIAAAVFCFLTQTRIGKVVRAATIDRDMVNALGVNVSMVNTIVFVLGAWLAGLGGVLAAPIGSVSLGLDQSIILECFAVVIIAGVGSVPGAFIGALLIGIVHSVGILIAPRMDTSFIFLVLCLILVFRPQGLMNRELHEQRDIGREARPVRKTGASRREGEFFAVSSKLWVGLLIFFCFLASLPFMVGESYLLLTADFMVMALFAMSFNLLLGQGGMLAFGQGAFYGLGAYTVAMVQTHLGWSVPLGLLLSPVVAALGALLIGLFCVRLYGIYFAILTLAFSQLFHSLIFSWYSVTGGDNGLSIHLPRYFLNAHNVYYLALSVLVVSVAILAMISRSAFGLALGAIRENRIRAGFIGLNVPMYRLAAFVIAGSFAGMAGGLRAVLQQIAFPDLLNWTTSGDAVLMALAGGIHTFVGPIVGAAIFVFLNFALTIYTQYSLLVFGSIVVLVVIFLPGGVVGFIEKTVEMARARSNQHASTHAELIRTEKAGKHA
jgi:branched-chain amino acid transport system permease protein